MLSRFRPRVPPRLYTLHPTLYTLKSHNFNKFCDFICPYQKNVVYLRSQFHAGDVCVSSAGVADILKRRLLTLCSDLLESRKFQEIQDLATIDVLRDIDYPSCACFWYAICVYMYAHTRTLTM
jgi:hypothetical protein